MELGWTGFRAGLDNILKKRVRVGKISPQNLDDKIVKNLKLSSQDQESVNNFRMFLMIINKPLCTRSIKILNNKIKYKTE